MKKALPRLFAVILAICLIVSAVISVSAMPPTESYTYWKNVGGQRKAVYGKAMFDVEQVIDISKLDANETEKVSRLTQITSMCKDNDDNIFILDAASRIVKLDKDYNYIGEFGWIDGSISYDNSKGLFYDDGVLYICNTEGKNILMINADDGKLIDTIELPDSNLIPDDFVYKPIKMTRDANGYMYVVSEGCYYGSLLYAPDRTFLGFYGSNTVNATIASVFTNISNRLFPNAEKHANQTKKLPFSFVDITIDEEGFVYTCNGFTDYSTASRNAQIRRLSPGAGTNILNSEVNFTDTEIIWIDNFSKQDICDIEVDSNGFIYALESQFDKIFVYDNECRVLSVFGGGMGAATQVGTFTNSSAIVIQEDGNKILVSDYDSNYITVFKINEYGKLVKELDTLTLNGEYGKTKEGWLKVLEMDANSQLAYSGLANAYLEEEDYESALKYAKLGYDKETYAVAFEYVRTDFISENFTWIFLVIVVLVIGVIAFMFVTNKKKVVLIKNKSLNLMLTTMIHPSNNFTDIKEKGLGSLPLCFVLMVLYYCVTVLKTISGGFLFSNYDPTSFNSIIELVRSVGLVVLWIVSNWLVCTLLGGKGKLKEIIIVTCYSLLPLILEGVLYIILSNVLLPVEAGFLSIMTTISLIYAAIMLVTGMLKIHDFNMGKFVWTTLLSVLGMAIIIFLIVMLIILVQQFGAFVVTLVTEISTI